MSVVNSSSLLLQPKICSLSLHGDRVNLLRREYHRRQQHIGTFASRNTANYNDNGITHHHRMRQLYSPICEHETRHCHEVANHYKDWCRSKIGRRAKKRSKRVVNARTRAISCAPAREALQIPRFDYPRYDGLSLLCGRMWWRVCVVYTVCRVWCVFWAQVASFILIKNCLFRLCHRTSTVYTQLQCIIFDSDFDSLISLRSIWHRAPCVIAIEVYKGWYLLINAITHALPSKYTIRSYILISNSTLERIDFLTQSPTLFHWT